MRTTDDLPAESPAAAPAHSVATGLPVVRVGRMITAEDVRALEDD